MCKYCNVEKNGDVTDTKFLIEKKAVFSDDMTYKKDGIKMSVNISEKMTVYASVFPPTKTLEFEALYQDMETNVFDFSAKINFCPMCGRKL